MHDQFCDGKYGLKCICQNLAWAREDERLNLIEIILELNAAATHDK